MGFIGFYIFKCRDGDEIRLKHYAGILVIEFWADLMYNMDTEEAAAGVPDHCQPYRLEAKMAQPARSACHDLYRLHMELN